MNAKSSGTPLSKKLGIKDGFAVVPVNAPVNYRRLLGQLPDEVSLSSSGPSKGSVDLVHLFTNRLDELLAELSKWRHLIKQNGSIWVSWYKKASQLPTEITEDIVREAAFFLGLVDIKVCGVDEKWSGLKLVIRLENRV